MSASPLEEFLELTSLEYELVLNGQLAPLIHAREPRPRLGPSRGPWICGPKGWLGLLSFHRSWARLPFSGTEEWLCGPSHGDNAVIPHKRQTHMV